MSDEAAERLERLPPRLDALRVRLDAMTERPKEVASTWSRLVSPLLRLVGWQAKFETIALFCLLDAADGNDAAHLADEAIDELEQNVATAERACAVHGYVPTAHASWLYRCEDLLRRAVRLAAGGTDTARKALRALDRTRVLAPLRTVETQAAADPPAEPAQPLEPGASRLIELELAAIDHIIEAARSETQFLERRRRLLEGARRLLLDANAALSLDRSGVVERQRHLAREITKIDRLEAAGLSATVALSYQAKQHLRRGDRDRLYAALVALDGFALATGDVEVQGRTGAALERLHTGAPSSVGDDAKEGLGRSATELFGADVVETIREQYATLRERAGGDTTDPELSRLALEYLAPGTEDAALSALVSVDGCFEVGASLSPVRVREIHEVARLVTHPTPELLLVPAREARDLPSAVVTDPRAILLDLAAGRLLARKFVRRDRRSVTRTRLIGEVRVYLLDGSTSMLDEGLEGARARVRDAILLAELATLMRRLADRSREVRLSLFYRFFTKRLGDLRRVATPAEALAGMADVVGSARKGGTDIQGALVSSMELIRDRKREDPDLARAGIVLVTDGNAPVDADVVRAAREDAGDVAISISVIALGEENPVLRDLVARQRARGERAFYHHLSDDALVALCKGDALGPAVHAPPDDRKTIDAGVEDLLLELEDLERSRAGRTSADEGRQGANALEEAATRDRASLDRRYERWFPPGSGKPPPNERPDESDEDVIAARVVLATIVEVVGELGGRGLRRKADAIDLVERLLPDARLSPARFHEVVARGALGFELGQLHRAVAGAAESFDDRLSRAPAG